MWGGNSHVGYLHVDCAAVTEWYTSVSLSAAVMLQVVSGDEEVNFGEDALVRWVLPPLPYVVVLAKLCCIMPSIAGKWERIKAENSLIAAA